MVTFSDMNTLLLTFFVLMFSMSSLRSEGVEMLVRSLSGDTLGLMQEGQSVHSSSMVFDPLPEVPKRAHRAALFEFSKSMQEEEVTGTGMPDAIEARVSDAPQGAIEIELADRILFEPGNSVLTPESKVMLDRLRLLLAMILTSSDRRITVEGHTDNSLPRREAYMLSARRAIAVVVYLLSPTEEGGPELPPGRIQVVGYGSSRPKATGDSPEDRAKNRRVRIYISPPDASIFSTGRE